MSDSDLSFYSTAAQVLPVLIAIVVWQARTFDRLPVPRSGLRAEMVWYSLVGLGLGFGVFGEVVCFRALAAGSPRHSDKGLVLDALVAAGLAAWVGLVPHVVRLKGRRDPRRPLLGAVMLGTVLVTASYLLDVGWW